MPRACACSRIIIQDIPGDEAGCRKVFEFGRKIGIKTFMSEPKPEALDTVEKFCDAYDINVALHNHDAKASPIYWQPAGILKACARPQPTPGRLRGYRLLDALGH